MNSHSVPLLTSYLSNALPLIVLGGLAALLVAWLNTGIGSPRPPVPVAKPLMTERERAMLAQLERILPMYRIHAQVAMGALLKVPARAGRGPLPSDRNAFAQKIIDFVIEDPVTGSVVALIEVDDRSHNADKDRARDAMTEAAGYRTLRIPAVVRPTFDGILDIVGTLGSEYRLAQPGSPKI